MILRFLVCSALGFHLVLRYLILLTPTFPAFFAIDSDADDGIDDDAVCGADGKNSGSGSVCEPCGVPASIGCGVVSIGEERG